MTKTIEVGERAPSFVLKDQDKAEHRLEELRGSKVLLSFHPLAWTGICAEQMKSIEGHWSEFRELDTRPFGISVDSSPSKLAWAKELGIERLPLLSDFWPHGGYADQLGLFREDAGTSTRANVILDEKGDVAWIKVYEISTLPDIQEVLEVLRGM
jgi:peroxiredoxin